MTMHPFHSQEHNQYDLEGSLIRRRLKIPILAAWEFIPRRKLRMRVETDETIRPPIAHFLFGV